MPTPIDQVLLQNIRKAIKESLVQNQHAQGVKGVARTGYYKLSTLLLASAVEAVLFDIIKCALVANPNLASLQPTKKLKKRSTLKAADIGTAKDLYICEELSLDYKLDKKALLDSLNKFAHKAGLIDQRLFGRIDRVRLKRNEQHLQGLVSSTTSYTRRTTEATSKALNELLDIRLGM